MIALSSNNECLLISSLDVHRSCRAAGSLENRGGKIYKFTSTKTTGIGRRRGANNSPGFPLHSVAVVGVSFLCTSIAIAVLYYYIHILSSMSIGSADDPKLGARWRKNTKARMKTKRIGTPDHNDGIVQGAKKSGKFGPILRGEIHLVELDLSDLHATPDEDMTGEIDLYRGAVGRFCEIDWSSYKDNPPVFPMFRLLVEESDCNNPDNVMTVDLAKVVHKAREYDKVIQGGDNSVHVIPPRGVVFHESRVGSTLAANSLAAMSPDAHRVYSESAPMNSALKGCELSRQDDDCTKEAHIQLLKDVVAMMGRTNSPRESNMFYKVSSIGSKRINLFQQAFPDVPWIFIFRDPVQTMMSHLDPSKVTVVNGQAAAVCTKSQRRPPFDLVTLVEATGYDVYELTYQEFCAAHLATLCESALKAMTKPHSLGKAVEYDNLVDKLISSVIPDHFGIEMTDEGKANILAISKTYSKSKGGEQTWVEDSQRKEVGSTPEIRDASDVFLAESYVKLKQRSIGR
ncbi:hypothetical protein THAOC_37059 [Thalassiosira oceanica]|uniref:Sulfotransferase domain-containing protein n=1 Tax=Thalassiosira oceanica TaxID=159749 RepID=K0RCZ6_THAOC|nr:hypothetical protein THAOC_37059 [Thalassiosira oceanica]|eukprot:EJK44402.1 hypothetical protein THAOC_37059 [Thalassiosira oceanica]